MLDIKVIWKPKKPILLTFNTSYTFYLKMIKSQYSHWVEVVKIAILEKSQILNEE